MQNSEIYREVEERYGAAARSDDNKYGERVAKQFGYSKEELENIPLDANLGLSCGNPHALANLKEGETVCDLGSGAGFDVFLAAKRVGPSGKAIGVDMNREMLERANQIKNKTCAANVSFVESRISKIALPDEIADCVISNCVINLVPDAEKAAVFKEIFRLLKPGGRVAVSDILAKKEMPQQVRTNMALYVGCIAGASQVAEYERYLDAAGFKDVLIVDTNSDLNALWQSEEPNGCAEGCGASAVGCHTASKNNDCCGNDSDLSFSISEQSKDTDFNEFAGSFKIYAVK